MIKQVFLFHEGNKALKGLLGSKGANLAEMTRIGLPVPPGFTITTTACIAYLKSQSMLTDDLKCQVLEAMQSIETETDRIFGHQRNPLFVSVRSGAQISMPGMMETILNLGLNDETIHGLIAQTQDERFAYDSYRRLISMFGNVVFGIDKDVFETCITQMKKTRRVSHDTELTAKDWQAIVVQFKEQFQAHAGRPFPQAPNEQLWLAIEAVFKSWNIPRAVAYRKHHHIPHDLGTAVNIQSMVFGNMGDDSATGVAFTRNPATGEKALYGEYLVNAQGEDVVAGIRTPQKISALAKKMPAVYQQFEEIATRLEEHYKEMQDIEFTIEKGRLYILQTRTGKRTARAAVQIAVDFVREGILSPKEAILMVDANQLPQLLLPAFDEVSKARNRANLVALGLGASPGAASGKIVFSPDEAEALAAKGQNIILVRPETTPDDIHGIIAAKGILTSRGGSTSHAAVVARGMGKPCVAGCESAKVDLKREILTIQGREIRKGEVLSIDGATGEVFLGQLETVEPRIEDEFEMLLSWADQYRTLGVRANADTPEDARKARKLGAKGIGLCRTEHMFMQHDRLPVMQRMILATDAEERQTCLNQLLPMQRDDFRGIFRAMEGHPVTIRLLDPPLHEFLPNMEELIEAVTALRILQPFSEELKEKETLLKTVRQMHESNPMLGFRGCRLGLLYPEINRMQVEAIFEAATDLVAEGLDIQPEIMIPLVGTAEELRRLRVQLERDAQAVMEREAVQVPYQFGTMIEVPRAALTAHEIAEYADFFSFGTNDLTQLTYGYSRDDAEGKFLSAYIEQGILPRNPFETLDTQGVGQLIAMAAEKGRRIQPNLKLGICGEHGGDAQSVAFCHQGGLNYVSCSPFRVPVARVAGAQAAIREAMEKQQAPQKPDLISV